MAHYLYCRVSTSGQTFAQQMQDIKAYGINPEAVDGIVEEHESGGTSYVDRKLQQLLNRCKPGDTIYAASTDRLGRSFVDMVRLMEDAKRRGIIITACKQNLSLADDNSIGKMILAVYAIIDEDERRRIRHRVKNGVDVAMDELRRDGERITRRGTKQTHWGAKKGCDMSAANTASCKAKIDAAIQWKEQSEGYGWVMEKVAEGWPRKTIIEEFNKLHKRGVKGFCTRTGKPLSQSRLSLWISEANMLMPAYNSQR